LGHGSPAYVGLGYLCIALKLTDADVRFTH
jgi:hypothetical protein